MMNRLRFHTNSFNNDMTPFMDDDDDGDSSEPMIMSLISLAALILLIIVTNFYRGLIYFICTITSSLLSFTQNSFKSNGRQMIDQISMIRPRMSPIKRKSREFKELVKPLPRNIANRPQPLFSFLFSNILPNRAASRLTKPLTHKVLPLRYRHFLLKHVFGSMYPVRWDDFNEDLSSFRTFHDFFTRKLTVKRKMAPSDLVSPVDGTIISFGEMDQFQTIEQVKGVRFGLKQFLYGFDTEFVNEKMRDLQRDILPGNSLFYTIIYLAPGDYHRFHCPADGVQIDCINHIVGDLYPVKPSYLKKVPGLFALNERMVLSGNWKKDLFFAYVPVGAFNIGSIHLRDDPYHVTNQLGHDSEVWYRTRYETHGLSIGCDGGDDDDINCVHDDDKSRCTAGCHDPSANKCINVFKPGQELIYNKGNEIGHFSFGSTVVLVFEAPKFEFRIERGEKVLFGQPLGDITSC